MSETGKTKWEPNLSTSRLYLIISQLTRHGPWPLADLFSILLLVTRAGSRYTPAPIFPCTYRTTQFCEQSYDSPLTDTLAHPRLALFHQRRDLYRPR